MIIPVSISLLVFPSAPIPQEPSPCSQLSAISYQPSVISHQRSVVSYQSSINLPAPVLWGPWFSTGAIYNQPVPGSSQGKSPNPLSRSSLVPQERLPNLPISNQKSQIENALIRPSFVFFPRNETCPRLHPERATGDTAFSLQLSTHFFPPIVSIVWARQKSFGYLSFISNLTS